MAREDHGFAPETKYKIMLVVGAVLALIGSYRVTTAAYDQDWGQVAAYLLSALVSAVIIRHMLRLLHDDMAS